MQKRPMQTKPHYKFFLLCLKRNHSQTFKSNSCEILFLHSVHVIKKTYFDECFLFRLFGSHSFLKRLSLLWDSFCRYVDNFFETLLWKKSVFRYLLTENAVLIAVVYILYLINFCNLIYGYVFTFFYFVTVPPWPTIFTRPDIMHFEGKNSRLDF